MADDLMESPSIPSHVPPPTGLRWEMRSFGRSFKDAESQFAKLEPSAPKETDEIYFLSSGGENVKVRDELMDIKVLREVNADGLEQWEPVMKAKFPLSADDAATVMEGLGVPKSAPTRNGYSLEALLRQFDQPNSGVRVVRVHKRRIRYTAGGCTAELSEITANGLPVRTIAVESEDPEAMMRAIKVLGLTGYTNISYLRGLADLLDDVPERFAIIDAGTNSIKFHIGERNADGSWIAVADRAELTRLGEGLAETGRISEAAVDRTAEAISDMVAEAKSHGVRAIAAVGTAGLRIAANSADVIAAIRKRSGVEVEVVSGDDEARLAYLATTAALGPVAGSIVVFDTGGGSSQFTFGHGGQVSEQFSVNVGAARYTELFGLDHAVSEDVLREAMAAISSELGPLAGRAPTDGLVGMGGAVTNITAVSLGMTDYDPDRVQGAVLTSDEIDRQIDLYRSRSADERRSIAGLQPKRAEVILAGACIVRTIMKKLGKTSFTVSDRGLRHGLLAERFGV